MEQGPLRANNAYRLFVGNMGSHMTESELRDIVRPFGKVRSVHVVKDGFTGLSNGYAFVDMTEAGHAARAALDLNGRKVDGHSLIVRPLF